MQAGGWREGGSFAIQNPVVFRHRDCGLGVRLSLPPNVHTQRSRMLLCTQNQTENQNPNETTEEEGE